MNIEELKRDKEQVENKFNQLIESELTALVNKYKGINVNVYFDYDTKETMGGTKYLTGKTKIRFVL